MDTRTGDMKLLSDLTDEDLKSGALKRIKREITARENKTKKIGRNDPCGCGSGKKFKKCCWTGRLKPL